MRFVILIVFLALFVLPTFAQNRKSVSAAEVNGTFETRDGNEFKILALGGNRLKIQFLGLYSYKLADGSPMANTGVANGTAVINGDTATFAPNETEGCTITLKFVKPGRLIVTEQNTINCGFGHNVTSGGSYRKVSSRKPKFDESL